MSALAEHGRKLTMLNVGGGSPVQYAGAAVPCIDTIGAHISPRRSRTYRMWYNSWPNRDGSSRPPAGVMVASVSAVLNAQSLHGLISTSEHPQHDRGPREPAHLGLPYHRLPAAG